MNLLDIVFTGF